MKIQYRILKRTGPVPDVIIECFPHCRIKRFLFWSEWKKIAKHPTGYALYGLPDYNYPKTFDECKQIIKDFNTWKEKESGSVNKYINIHNPYDE